MCVKKDVTKNLRSVGWLWLMVSSSFLSNPNKKRHTQQDTTFEPRQVSQYKHLEGRLKRSMDETFPFPCTATIFCCVLVSDAINMFIVFAEVVG